MAYLHLVLVTPHGLFTIRIQADKQAIELGGQVLSLVKILWATRQNCGQPWDLLLHNIVLILENPNSPQSSSILLVAMVSHSISRSGFTFLSQYSCCSGWTFILLQSSCCTDFTIFLLQPSWQVVSHSSCQVVLYSQECWAEVVVSYFLKASCEDVVLVASQLLSFCYPEGKVVG